MKEPVKEISNNCVKCNKKLNQRDKDILFLSDFFQSWCEKCLLCYQTGHPSNSQKIDCFHEYNRIVKILQF